MAKHVTAPRGRPVKLNLDEDLVVQARRLTDNLSRLAEHLLADYRQQSGPDREQRARAVRETLDAWNAFATVHGSLADEYSTL